MKKPKTVDEALTDRALKYTAVQGRDIQGYSSTQMAVAYRAGHADGLKASVELARLLRFAITHGGGRHLMSEGFLADANDALEESNPLPPKAE